MNRPLTIFEKFYFFLFLFSSIFFYNNTDITEYNFTNTKHTTTLAAAAAAVVEELGGYAVLEAASPALAILHQTTHIRLSGLKVWDCCSNAV